MIFYRHSRGRARPAWYGVPASGIRLAAVSVGIAAHGVGTARAFQLNEQGSAFAALAAWD